jgi:hypothetical protein
MAPFLSVPFKPTVLVARQRLLQDGDQGAVSGQEHRTRLAERPPPRGDVQPDEGLAGAGDSCDEDDGLLVPRPSPLDDLLDAPRGDLEVLGTGVVARDRVDRVAGVQRTGSLDDRRRRLIGGPTPSVAVEGGLVDQRQGLVNRPFQVGDGRPSWRPHPIVMRGLPCRIPCGRPGGDEDREDRRRVAGLMEVLQVEPIVPGLVVGVGPEKVLAALELDREDRWPTHQGGIEATSQPGDVELQEEGALEADECGSENANLLCPSATLLGLERAEGVRHREPTDHRVGRRGEELGDRCAVVGRERAPLRGDRHEAQHSAARRGGPARPREPGSGVPHQARFLAAVSQLCLRAARPRKRRDR